MKEAIVIGAGIAGIATSLRLNKKGYRVSVYEAQNEIGGKLGFFESNAYRFDTGPSLFTLPELVDDLFRLYNIDPKEKFDYYKHDVSCNYFFEDGTVLNFYTDRNKLKTEIVDRLNVDAEPFFNFLDHAQKMYNISAPIFLKQSLHLKRNYLNKSVFKALFNLPVLHLNRTMHEVSEKKLNHPKLVQIADRYATYNGSDPYRAPGVLTMIPHLEQNIGTYFPKKGMRDIAESLVQFAREQGVEIHTSLPVEEILVENKKAKGVKVNGQIKSADLVVSNVDIYYTYNKLLPSQEPPKKQLEQERSTSAFIFYWGVKKVFPELDLHNILFTQDYKEEFKTLFNGDRPYKDPTIYVHISSKLVKEDAPEGCENWFVMVNSPIDKGQDWRTIQKEVRQSVLGKLSRVLGKEIEPLIEVEDVLTPQMIDKKTGSYQGALYGTSSNHKYAAFLRHPNFKKKIKNLYFCGGTVHPGGGIPLCLLSAKIVTDLCPEVQ